MINKIQLSDKTTNFLIALGKSSLALVTALFIGGVIISLGGYSFVEVYVSIFKGSLGTSRGLILTLATATPIMLTGLGFALGIKVGIVNTGLEGQLYAGAMIAALVGAYIPLPSGLHTAVALLAGGAAGGLIGALMSLFKIRFGAPEVITGIMLNSVVMFFTSYLSNVPLKPEGAAAAQTKEIFETARLTRIVPRSQLTTALFIAILMCILVYFMHKKTVWGYQMMVIGLNPRAADVAGINSSYMYTAALSLSGFMAGLAGSGLVLGIFRRFIEEVSSGLGFQGIPVSALAGHNPLGVIASALLFGALEAGSLIVNQSTAIPFEFVDVVQALVVVFVAAPAMITDPFKFVCMKIRKRRLTDAISEVPHEEGE
jgi:ABC-type uncharacterized transport system permease subunit